MRKEYFFIFLGLWLLAYSNSLAQKAPVNRWVFIQSAQEYDESNKGFWDVPGYPDGMSSSDVHNIQVYEKEVEPDRQFSFINLGGNKYDIAAGHAIKSHVVKWKSSLKKNGVNVQIERKTGDGSDEIYNRQQFTFKYVGAGRWKIYSDDGRVMCLEGKSSDNSTNVHLWEDHDGLFTEWLFIDAHTNEVIYPEFTKDLGNIQAGAGIHNQEIKNTLAQIDQTYNALYAAEKKVFNNMQVIMETKKIVDESYSVVNDFDDLNTQVYAAEKASIPLTKIPYVKAIFSPVNSALGHLSPAMEKTNEKLTVIGEDVVFPTHERFKKSREAVYDNESRLAYAMDVLKKMKRVYANAARAATMAGGHTLEQFASYAPELNKELKRMEKIAHSMTRDFETIRELNDAIKERKDPINKAYSSLRKIAGALEETSDASEDIKNFMQKKYGVGNKKLSVEDLIDPDTDRQAPQKLIEKVTGIVRDKIGDLLGVNIPEMPSTAAGAEKMASDFVKDKLGINDMSFPIVDEFNKKMEEIGEKSAKVTDTNTRLMMNNANLHNASASLRDPFEKSLACIPFEHLQRADLTELSVK